MFGIKNPFNYQKPETKIKSITSLESFNLHLSGMRITEEYEIVCEGDKATVSHYVMNYSTGEQKRELESSATLETQAVLDKLDELGVASWNGFHGEHPKGVLDGTMFNLTAYVNGGQKLYADGSQNFPKHFHELEEWFYEVLRD
ncbi:MAG: hypothetical protein IKF64_04855 [Eubacterium sp.]|nr:hypothetical protein [Eubacterium sp.]